MNEATFDSDVLGKPDEKWIIYLYTTEDCATCPKLAGIVHRDSKRLRNKVKVASINAQDTPKLAERLGVTTFPAIRYFLKSETGQRTEADAKEYKTLDIVTIMPLADDMLLHHDNELERLTDGRMFNMACKPRSICVVFFLPSAAPVEQAEYIELIHSEIKKIKDLNFVFFWTEYGVQTDIEEQLGLTSHSQPTGAALRPF